MNTNGVAEKFSIAIQQPQQQYTKRQKLQCKKATGGDGN